MAIKRTILSLLCAAAAAAATAQTNDADSIGTPDVLMAEVVEVPDTTAQTAAVKPSRYDVWEAGSYKHLTLPTEGVCRR